MAAIAFALSASFAWGASDFLGGLKSRKLALLAVMLPSQATALALITLIVVVRGDGAPPAPYVGYAALAGVAATVGLAALYRGMAVGDISVIAPITATAAVVPVAFGILTGDRLSAWQLAGVVLALIGVALASREPSPRRRAPTAAVAGVGFALLAALAIGCFFVAMDAASKPDPFWASLVHRLCSVAVISAAVIVTRPSVTVSQADLGHLVTIGALEIAANLSYAIASRDGLVSIVSVLASLYAVTTVLLARAVLGERLSSVQLVGVISALAAVGLISAG